LSTTVQVDAITIFFSVDAAIRLASFAIFARAAQANHIGYLALKDSIIYFAMGDEPLTISKINFASPAKLPAKLTQTLSSAQDGPQYISIKLRV
jgi:hypothetical protein